MLSKKRAKNIIIMGIVILTIGIGLIILFNGIENEILDNVGGVVFAIGCGIMGGGFGELYKVRKLEKDPDRLRRFEVDIKDERSISIREKAGAKSGNIVNWIILACAYLSIIFNGPAYLTFGALGIFVFKFILEIVLISKYHQEL